MRDRVFLDTNVLVYLYDNDAPEKQAKSRSILEQGQERFRVVVSTQVFQEFYVTVTKKLSRFLSEGDILQAIADLDPDYERRP